MRSTMITTLAAVALFAVSSTNSEAQARAAQERLHEAGGDLWALLDELVAIEQQGDLR